MKRIRTPIFLTAILLGVAPPVSPALMTSMGFPGMDVVITRNGAIVSNTSYGVRNVKSGTPVDAHTRFEIGSITKQFTAAAILQLAERGKLSLDDKLQKYIPQYLVGKDITLRQMLLQVSGIPSYTDSKQFEALVVNRNGTLVLARPGNLQAVLALIADKPLDFTPGSKWKYSNSNYYLLGHVVEVASGLPWDRYIARKIFASAGMTESSFMEDEANLPDMATGYARDKKSLVPTGTFSGWAGGAGAIVSTGNDMAKWDLALLDDRIVSDADRRLMMTGGDSPAMSGAHYGFGWIVDTYDGQPRIWHNGGTLGFSASNQYYPTRNEIIIVLANSIAGSADDVADAAFDALHPDLAAEKAKAAQNEDPSVTARVKAFFAQIVGGNVDRSQLTDFANKTFTSQLLAQAKATFSDLGEPKSWIYKGKIHADYGMTTYKYYVTFANGAKLYLYMAVDDATNKIAVYRLAPN